jgi:hypothetical protein
MKLGWKGGQGSQLPTQVGKRSMQKTGKESVYDEMRGVAAYIVPARALEFWAVRERVTTRQPRGQVSWTPTSAAL